MDTRAGRAARLPIDLIRTDGGTQPRDTIDMIVVSEYAEAMENGETFPPVTVFYDGSEYWLADGFHRYHATKRADRPTIEADLRQGTRRDAVLCSVGANAAHGLRRTNEDKRRAVVTLLSDEEWREWPDSKIAQYCGVSREYVVRLKPSCDRSQDGGNRTITRNGSTYTMNTANIGRPPAAFLPSLLAAEGEEEEEDYTPPRYESGARAYCKYCYSTHSDWRSDEWRVWTCERCDHRTHDDFMDIEEAPESVPQQEWREVNAPRLAVHFSSDTVEWYTPAHIIARVVQILGTIDLDPCSNSHEAPNVPATHHYTKEDDGLAQLWHGRVYMNSPYGRELADWVAHLLREWQAGRVTEAIALVTARTDTQWFRTLREFPRCYLWGRLRFSEHDDAAPFPSMAVYLGQRLDAFLSAFSDIGDVYPGYLPKESES